MTGDLVVCEACSEVVVFHAGGDPLTLEVVRAAMDVHAGECPNWSPEGRRC